MKTRQVLAEVDADAVKMEENQEVALWEMVPSWHVACQTINSLCIHNSSTQLKHDTYLFISSKNHQISKIHCIVLSLSLQRYTILLWRSNIIYYGGSFIYCQRNIKVMRLASPRSKVHVHICLPVRGAPWWLLLQHSIMLRWFFIVECGIARFLCAMSVFDVQASSSSHRLPLCQISFLRPPLSRKLMGKNCLLCQSLTGLIWCTGNWSACASEYLSGVLGHIFSKWHHLSF